MERLFFCAAVAALCMTGCKMQKGISGALGLKWGEDAAAAAGRIGVRCAEWRPWAADEGIQVCMDLDHKVAAFGGQAYARLLRRGGHLLGMQLVYPQCDEGQGAAVGAAVDREFGLSPGDATRYHQFPDGSAVHVARDRADDSCTVTVAGPEAAGPFSRHLMKGGMGALGESLKPR